MARDAKSLHEAQYVARRRARTLDRVIHSYPTQAEAIRKAADAYNRTRLTPAIRSVLRLWLKW